MRLFLAYAEFNSRSIREGLGKADYSYYFVLRRYIPLLEEFGEVEVLDAPPTDDLVRRRKAAGGQVYFFSFTPPDKAVQLSECPVIPVFAWEYSSIPDEPFTGPGDDWVSILRASAGAITHSSHALNVLREQVGEGLPGASIPAPLWDDFSDLRARRGRAAPGGLSAIQLAGTVIDSASYDISNTAVKPRLGGGSNEVDSLRPQWGGEPLLMPLRKGVADDRATLIGFNDCEDWGVWTRSGFPWMMLQETVQGEVELVIEVCGYAENIGKPLYIELGEARACILLSETLRCHRLRLQVESPTSFLTFQGVGARAEGMPDPRDIGIGLSLLEIRRPEGAGDAGLELDLRAGGVGDSVVAHGFHPAEAQGRWTAQPWCLLELPRSVAGPLALSIEFFHSFQQPGSPVRLSLGGVEVELEIAEGATVAHCQFDGVAATDFLVFDGVSLQPSGNPEDSRQLGLGIARITLSRDSARPRSRLPTLKPPALPAGAILYTAVLNPNDGRKNWEDIVTAFVYAFRQQRDATLLIKIASQDMSLFFEDIFTFFMELHPFDCRLVFLQGYLDDTQYRDMVANTHFVVNASRGEGQCLPLMEFMSSGVPAIAPGNTAMGDYLDAGCGFPVRSSPELTYWPHDPRQVYRTCWHRIDWESLRDAFTASRKCWKWRRWRYNAMGRAAAESQRHYCGGERARESLGQFLEQVDRRMGD
ncbi:glycosyltransferase [Parahaliea mediterranea]|uniref:Glycosyltransferase n=1 Tax=Parahaliea mediterranea TaxID=651086 RepID=A0A939DC46_9GAMM|nr:glycosyltransferase [Parahaliea mediterranea]MBN7795191.1 glycosyltransferase [Parahaliea mediterranea]